MEAAVKNAQDLRNNYASAACHKMCSKADSRASYDEGMQASNASKSCFRCKGTNHTARKSGKSTKIKQTGIKLETYTGQPIEVRGTSQVTVEYQEQKKTLPVAVMAGNGPNLLLGRGWLAELKLSWIKHDRQVLQIQTEDELLRQMLVKHSDVFKEELGTLKGVQAKIHVSPEAVPRFFRPRSVRYAMRTKVDEELNRLQKEHVIRPLTVTRAASLEQYPIPRLEDLCSTLSGGKKFSKLDLSHAYQQVVVDEESQKFLTINTQRGLFTYQLLPFGVASAPAIFQRIMERLVQGIPKVAVYLDDILITGVDTADHLENLGAVLKRLEDAGLRLKREKCVFLQGDVEYLGHRVTLIITESLIIGYVIGISAVLLIW
ncbi:hypothetical protein H4Q32_028452 [Labeo rohita]|uniref:ribonuclease H n=1 Tax=Labeo rohita TaxID=84645 RepID=A0ABQ8L4P5_LABRO|nr:hypothetical protein H4Q32_028452 [Labeo rohita]